MQTDRLNDCFENISTVLYHCHHGLQGNDTKASKSTLKFKRVNYICTASVFVKLIKGLATRDNVSIKDFLIIITICILVVYYSVDNYLSVFLKATNG